MSRFKDSWGKAKILLSQLLCIGAVFTACIDDEVINQTTKALQVSVSIEASIESRAIIDGGYLPDGASIGVTLTAEDGSAYDGQAFTNLQYTASGEGSAQTWSSATPASLSITAGKVIAYYPYYGGDDFDLKAVPVETASQTAYMYAKPVTGINMVSPAANLTMQHAMTDIRINVKKGTYTGTGEVTKITAKAPAFATTATMDVETGVFANVSGSGAQFVQELTGAAISSGNIVHDFLIVPDAKSTSGDVSIFVIIDGKKFAVTVPYTESFQQGFAYTYNLTLDNAALTLDGVSVAKWGVNAEVDESLQFYDDQYIVEIQVPSDNYEFVHNINGFVGTIDWGDGTTDTYTESSTMPTHTYITAGNYTVTVEGKLIQISSKPYNSISLPSKIITKLVRIGKEMGVTKMGNAFYNQTLLSEIIPGAMDGCTEVTNFGRSSYMESEGVFNGCINLTEIPVGLFDKCTEVTSFYNAFYGCENLTTIPEGLFDSCTEVTDFSGAFLNCVSLQSVPDGLFDKSTKVTSFEGTFEGCESLTSIPAGLFDKCTEVTSFYKTFRGCENLISIPVGLFDCNTNVSVFLATFRYCTKIQAIPNGLFDKCTEVKDFRETFYGCKSLKEIPQGLFDNCTKVTHFSSLFSNCNSITSIPEGLFDKCTKVTDFSSTFAWGASIMAIPEGLFDKCTEVTSFYWTFYGCSNLTKIPGGLFDKCIEVINFEGTFANTVITKIPEGLFDKCTKVTNFQSAFSGCTSLQTIPEGLFDECTEVTSFQQTFLNCEKLQNIPIRLFDSCTKVKSFYRAFLCYNNTSKVSGESPYTVININGVDTKVHLYERADYPEYFTAPTSYSGCFYKCTNLTDYSSIPSGWKSY